MRFLASHTEQYILRLMKISVIIPTYNEAQGIVAMLEQFQEVRSAEFEVLISDNGSTDDTIIKSQPLCDRLVTLPTDVRSTIGECRNRGAKAATGDILWFVDADVRVLDIASVQHRIKEMFARQSKLVGLTLPITIYSEEVKFADKFWYGLTNVLTFFFNQIVRVGSGPGDCQIVRRTEFERLQGFNPTMVTSEDHELFGRLAKRGRIKIIWQHPVQMSPRRIRRDGWPKVLRLWVKNWFNFFILHKIDQGEWEERR